MAGVFLSYDRDDGGAARIIATALEKAGHAVWWDLHVRGGAQFSKVIEDALKAADVVVVLWSAQSIDSAWVRDEAAIGRDSGRLVPATIDGTEPPLGFRQFQTIELHDWKRGAKSRGYQELEQSLAGVGDASLMMTPPVHPRSVASPLRPPPAWVAAVLTLALVAIGAFMFWPSSSKAVPTVTVEAASNSAASQALSRDLLAKLGTLQSLNSQTLQLVEQGGGATPDLIFKVEGSNDGDKSKATLLLLSGRKHALLWSGNFEQPSNKSSDLKQQLAYGAASLLDCASDAYGPSGRSLADETRRLYLKGCGDFSQGSGADMESLARTFREVTRRAPNFQSAWEQLLYAEDELIFTPPYDRDTAATEARLRADIGAARKVNPDMAAGYIVEADLARSDGRFMDHVRTLDRAAERNPDNPEALIADSQALLQVGRMKEAVTQARRAVQIRPFSPRTQQALISALTYSGRLDDARQELSRGYALFPETSNLNAATYGFNLRYGSPEAALKQLQRGDFGYVGQETFLAARIDPTSSNITKAIEVARRRIDSSSGGTVADYIQILSQFGRNDELLDFLLKWGDAKHLGFIGVLFRPTFHDFWRDPRSMQVAAKFGFVGYWKSTGKWPDFCGWPDLPYDCKKEAAKLKA